MCPLFVSTKKNGKVRRFCFSLPNKLYVRRIIWIKHVGLWGHIVRTTKNNLSQWPHISTRADVFTSSLHEAYLTHGHHTPPTQCRTEARLPTTWKTLVTGLIVEPFEERECTYWRCKLLEASHAFWPTPDYVYRCYTWQTVAVGQLVQWLGVGQASEVSRFVFSLPKQITFFSKASRLALCPSGAHSASY